MKFRFSGTSFLHNLLLYLTIILDDQQLLENNKSSPSSDNADQTSVDLAMVNEDQPVVFCLPGIGTSHPPLAVCSGDLSIIEPVSEMNVP